MKTKINLFIAVTLTLLFYGCSQPQNQSAKEILQDSTKQAEIMDAICNDSLLMSNMMTHIMKNDSCMHMMNSTMGPLCHKGKMKCKGMMDASMCKKDMMECKGKMDSTMCKEHMMKCKGEMDSTMCKEKMMKCKKGMHEEMDMEGEHHKEIHE